MFFREDFWGVDAREFRPERWQGEGYGGTTPAEKLREMEATTDLA
ncbi:pisatin demethylase [Colletotrichum tabaci]|uniref:Pisatin demethylase n=1 Tax=Colletotrichum tabaci TaxID=1209068 RepID=A0AAV9TFN9_9PEZI